jgi:hypothetical protein
VEGERLSLQQAEKTLVFALVNCKNVLISETVIIACSY